VPNVITVWPGRMPFLLIISVCRYGWRVQYRDARLLISASALFVFSPCMTRTSVLCTIRCEILCGMGQRALTVKTLALPVIR